MTFLREYLFTTIAVVGIVIYLGYQIWLRNHQRCEKCGGTLRLDPSWRPSDDSGGGVFKRPVRKQRAFKCELCGNVRIRQLPGYDE